MGHVDQSKILKYVVFAIMIQVLLDCGAVQADALTVDRLASLEKVWAKTLVYQTSSPFLRKKWKKNKIVPPFSIFYDVCR